MPLADELQRIAGLAAAHADADDTVSGVIATEPVEGRRVYLVAYDGGDGFRSWLAVDAGGTIVTSRRQLREAVTVAALCELASDAVGGGDLDALVARLRELRETEAPPGIEDAESAARDLRAVLADPPQVASSTRLDDIGAATRRLERELDPAAASSFAAVMRSAEAAVAELQREIEAGYRVPLV